MPSLSRALRLCGDLLTYDFRGGDRFVRCLGNPFVLLCLAAAVAAFCGLHLHPQCMVLVWGIVAILVLGLVWPALSVLGLRVELRFDQPRCREGETATLRVTLRNRKPVAAWGLLVRGLGEHGHEAVQGTSWVGAWRTVTATWEFTPRLRGVYPAAQPRLACGFPFGLWEARRRIGVAQTLLVWPQVFPVGPLPESAGRQHQEAAVLRDRAGSVGDTIGVRPYRRGDPLRRVHWAHSARQERLIVRELQTPDVPHVQILLDVHAAAHRGDGAASSLEAAVRAAASLAEGWLDDGAVVELVWAGQHLAADAGAGQHRRLLDALAALTPCPDTTLATLLAQPVCRRQPRGARIIIMTDLALHTPLPRAVGQGASLFLVLCADAFATGQAVPSPCLPVRPWLLITDPNRLPHQLRHGAEGTSHAS